ncbi:MAG: hypothetical protein QM528_04195 [Phycisphaerales bacterium]|nr:hypothetical protein [Phycisphaerales bacterium]
MKNRFDKKIGNYLTRSELKDVNGAAIIGKETCKKGGSCKPRLFGSDCCVLEGYYCLFVTCKKIGE